jgi:hypothetical protein
VGGGVVQGEQSFSLNAEQLFVADDPGLVLATAVGLFPAVNAAVPTPLAHRELGFAEECRNLVGRVPFFDCPLA